MLEAFYEFPDEINLVILLLRYFYWITLCYQSVFCSFFMRIPLNGRLYELEFDGQFMAAVEISRQNGLFVDESHIGTLLHIV